MAETLGRPWSRRRKLLWTALVLLPFLGCGGFNAWRHARLGLSYRGALEAHLQAQPGDAEAWFALATGDKLDPGVPGEPEPDAEALRRAIEREPRPLFLLTDLHRFGWMMSPEKQAAVDRLQALAPEAAISWLILAEAHAEAGRIDEAFRAAERALACPSLGYRAGEGVDVHRRFLRRFYGDGYAADTLILRHEHVDSVRHYGWRGLHIVNELVGRRWSAGDLPGARAALEALYRLCEGAGDAAGKWQAASALAALAMEEGARDVETWLDRAALVRPRQVITCGNVYYNDDPWILDGSWPGHHPYVFLAAGAWMPVWHWFHRDRFHAIAENLGKPDAPYWRRADLTLRSGPGAFEPAPREQLAPIRELLHRPVSDEAAYHRLLAEAPTCDAAVRTLVRSNRRLSTPPPAALSPAVAYIYTKHGAYRDLPEKERRKMSQLLAQADSTLWGMDAWKLAAAMDREAFLDATVGGMHPHARLERLRLLRELTGQTFGFDSAAWSNWLFYERRKASKK